MLFKKCSRDVHLLNFLLLVMTQVAIHSPLVFVLNQAKPVSSDFENAACFP